MKKYFLILLIGIYSVCLNAQLKPIEVILIGGQSNATGQGYMKNIPVDFHTNQSVLFYYSKWLNGGGKPTKWVSLCQASESPDRFGVELSLGTSLQNLWPDKKIALIKHALSGSDLYNLWNPGKHNKDTINFGKEYKKFIYTVETALEQLRKKGYKPTIRAMVWQQGEADARDIAGMRNSYNYGKNLRHFIKRVRKQFDSKNMLFIYGYVIPVPLPRFTGREDVRLAQKNIDQNSNNPLALKNAFVINTDDLPLRCDEPKSPNPDDKVHFNTLGILELGKRFAKKINEYN